jgi:hypothetical protein
MSRPTPRAWLIGGCLAAALATATPAHGQAAPVEAAASVSPSKSGTARKPKKARIKFSLKNGVANATTSRIVVYVAKDVRIVPRNLKACDKTRLDQQGPSACPSGSKAGSGGTARAVVDPTGLRMPVDFTVTTYVGSRSSLLLYLQQKGGGFDAVLEGRLSRAGGKFGQALTFDVPQDLQQPTPGSYTVLEQLTGSIGGGTAKKPVINSTGCPRTTKRHVFAVQLQFAPNPAPPPVASARAETLAKCS